MMRFRKISIAFCLASLVALLLAHPGFAVPPQPMLVYGTVLWNGANVPAGTKVSAWCGSLIVGSVETSIDQGVTRYAMPVVGDDTSTTSTKEGCSANETVAFKLDTDHDSTWDFNADQTTTWTQGGITALNLTINPQPAVSLEKRTNGQDVAAPPGPYIVVGQAVSWTYLVNNTGNVKLLNIAVTDAKVTNLSCPKTALNAGESMTCTASGTAAKGQYTNTGSVAVTPPGGLPGLNASDQSYYFGADPAISIKKYTNGQDADTPAAGPYIPVGDAISWTYSTSNTGNVTLTGVTVTDSRSVFVSCPKNSLAAGESMTCTAQGSATAGQYSNTGTASGTYSSVTKTASDLSHYFGAILGLTIEARTNGQDADSPPGPSIVAGQPVSWSYELTNTSNVPLTNVVVSDSRGVAVTCPKTTLAAGEAMTCTASGTAVTGQYSNTGNASGTPPGGLPVQAASDLSHYFGADPKLSIKTRVMDQEADTPPGVYILTGQPVNLSYIVSNTGNVTLSTITVTDSLGAAITCPKNSLAALESMVCTASTTAAAGQRTHAGTASTTFSSIEVNASDPANYFGAQTGLILEARTNGQDADSPPGPEILAGQPVAWTYIVSNTGNVALSGVSVTDDRGVTVSCPKTTLAASESITCTANGTATAGQYSNNATARGTPPGGLPQVSASDPSNYFGVNPQLSIQTRTNGQDANTPTGPYIATGSPVSWSYVVSNTGNVVLPNIQVSDSRSVSVTCPKTTLAAAEQMTCTASGTAAAGQYSNIGTASTTYLGAAVTASDPSHYYGASPAIGLEKRTNGLAATASPGPALLAGTTVTWTYKVTNTGNVPLSNVTVIDNQGETVTCPGSSLAAGATLTCSATGTAEPGQYSNTGTASGTPPGGLPAVSSQSTNTYFGAAPAIALGVRINNKPAITAPGPYALTGTTVTWTYTITNTGNIALSQLQVVDSSGLTVSCPFTDLPVNTNRSCSAQHTAGSGQFSSTATASARFTGALENKTVSAIKSSYYFAANPIIQLEKRTNGTHYTAAPGAYILVGNPVTWTYMVKNAGNVPLTGAVVTDDRGVNVTCPKNSLAVDESMTCSASGMASAGQYSNLGTVTATPPGGLPAVTANDPSFYFGSTPSVSLVTSTNGQDANSTPGPYIPVGQAVSWSYLASNTGNVNLTSVTVTDSKGVSVSCPKNILAVAESMTCTASGTATAGQYSNTGTVTATPPGGLGNITASDPSHYFGAQPGITIETRTNGQDADAQPGVYIITGQPVNWTYVINNTGNVPLTSVTVTDNHSITVSCSKNTLAAGEQITCTASGTAALGQYDNVGSVTANPPVGLSPVGNSDPSHYFGANPVVTIEVKTNTNPADAPPGQYIKEGDPVNWTYELSNAGNVILSGILVIDDRGVTVSCPGSTLNTSAAMTCTASGLATVGQYSNIGTVSATPPGGLSPITASDPSHYIGYSQDPSLDIRKYTNGADANTAPGFYVPAGAVITWKYVINNTGGVPLTNVFVTDDNGTPGNPSDDFKVCETSSLASLTSFDCTKTSTAITGQYGNVATAKGTFENQLYDASDSSHYFGATPAVALELYANNQRADSATGPYILTGTSVSWTYAITNTGNVPLSGIQVSDDKGTNISCPQTSLAPNAHTLCTASSTVTAGQFSKTATVTAAPPGSLANVTANDPAFYFGASPSLSVVTSTKDQDANSPPGPYIPVGQPVSWKYLVTNTGNVPLTSVGVTDNKGASVTCPATTLASGGTTTCTASGAATAGQFNNTGTAAGTPPGGLSPVTASDPSHYFGALTGITLVLSTNGQDANEAPGAYVLVGQAVSWTYHVTNNGNVSLSAVVVSDNRGVTVTCPKNTLAAGEQITCTASSTAVPGPYSNTGTVTAAPPAGLAAVSDTDPSNYFGSQPAISLVAYTNGQDANAAPGPYILAGQPVAWSYVVKNNGNVQLTSVLVTDNPAVSITCPKDTLALNETITCTASGTGTAGQYSNTATATATPPGGLPGISASDPSHYFGADPVLTLEMRTNGVPTPGTPGPYALVGSQVNWSYLLRNTGNITLSSMLVSDSSGVIVSCTKSSLAPGENQTCTANGTATAGQYSTLATASGTPPGNLAAVHPTSPGYYFGAQPAIQFRAYTNGEDANAAPGPYIHVNDSVQWTYTVTNTGNVNLATIAVTDDRGVSISCPKNTLSPAEMVTCTASGKSTAGQYANVASVSATPPGGLSPISATDPSHYYGANLSIQLNKLINNQDSNSEPGPYILAGTPVDWTYLVSNTGNAPLENIQVSDERTLTINCPYTLLQAGASMTCTASAEALPGVADELGTASGSLAGKTVTDSDPAYYFGVNPALKLELRTNGQDAAAAPGAYVPVGGAIHWTYTILNQGNVTLSGVSLSAGAGPNPACPPGTTLGIGQQIECTAEGTALAGQHTATATAQATPPGTLAAVTTSDTSYYFGYITGLQLNTLLDGKPTQAPGPFVLTGSELLWEHHVMNTSNVPLENVTLKDGLGAVIACPKTTLGAGEEMICTPGGTALAGAKSSQYRASSSFLGQPVESSLVTAHYFGASPILEIVVLLNGNQNNDPPGPSFLVGNTLSWSYTITNKGNVTLNQLSVTDSQGSSISCPQTELAPGAKTTCTAQNGAAAGVQTNLATASATAPVGPAVTASDQAHYYGINPEITLQVTANGLPTDNLPGPGIREGETVTMTVTVLNSGNVPLVAIELSGDILGELVCPQTSLGAGEDMVCEATEISVLGQHTHVFTVQASYGDVVVWDIRTSYYKGIPPIQYVYLPFVRR